MADELFISISIGLGVLLFFAAFGVKRFSPLLSVTFLLIASVFSGFGFADWMVVYFEKRMASSPEASPPDIFSQVNTSPHILLKDSILYVAPPSGNFRTFGHKFSTNSLGFREKEFSFEKEKGAFRILVLGDSLTFGVGIDNDHRYTNVLEEMLNLRSKPKKYEVLNFGMGGYSTDQEVDLLKGILKKVQCDLVIVGFFWNDFSMTTQQTLDAYVSMSYPLYSINIEGNDLFTNTERNYNAISKTTPDEFLNIKPWYKQTGIYRFVEMRSNINRNGMLPNEKLWQFERNELMGMMELTRQYSLPPPVVVLLYNGFVDPHKNNFRKPKGQLAQYIQLEKFVGEKLGHEGFSVIDPLPYFEKYSGMSMSVSEWETHPNYLPHYIFAQSIFDYLVARKIVDAG